MGDVRRRLPPLSPATELERVPQLHVLEDSEGIYPNTDYSNTCAKGKEITSAARCRMSQTRPASPSVTTCPIFGMGRLRAPPAVRRAARIPPAARILSPQRACQAPQQHGVMPHPRACANAHFTHMPPCVAKLCRLPQWFPLQRLGRCRGVRISRRLFQSPVVL